MRFAFLGDLLVGESVPMISDSLKHHLADHDVRCVNLEGPLHGVGSGALKAGPCVANSHHAKFLINDASVNLICTANNHFMDFGPERAEMTLDEIGVQSWGTHIPGRSSAVIQFQDEFGQLISLVAGTESFNGSLDDLDPMDSIGPISITSRRFREILVSEVASSDFVIVITHCGVEGINVPLPEWRALFRGFVDLGVRAVIAHHPHTVQPWELYRGAPIFYSLGNFFVERRYNGGSTSGLCLTIETGPETQLISESRAIETSEDQKQVVLLESDVTNQPESLDDGERQIGDICVGVYQDVLLPMLNDSLNAFGLRPTWRDVLSLVRTRLARKYVETSEDASRQRIVTLEHLFRVESNRWLIQRALRRMAQSAEY